MIFHRRMLSPMLPDLSRFRLLRRRLLLRSPASVCRCCSSLILPLDFFFFFF
ncbi:hypothetical protein Hanom_Chr02g00171591 [Helianthus anomalus]